MPGEHSPMSTGRRLQLPQCILGSAQQSDEGRILGGFLKSDEFGLGGGQSLCLQQQIVQIAVTPATP